MSFYVFQSLSFLVQICDLPILLSPFAQYVAKVNLLDELNGNHIALLINFAHMTGGMPEGKDYEEGTEAAANIHENVRFMSGLRNITLIATLENTSAIFIPFLDRCAKKLDRKGRGSQYLDKHGSADIKHAELCLEALTDEMRNYPHVESAIMSTINETISFLEDIFCQ